MDLTCKSTPSLLDINQGVGDRAIPSPKFSNSCLIVRYNNKLQPFCPPKVVQKQVKIILLPGKYQLVVTLLQI